MEAHKLHIRLGEHEFNAEGDKDTVDRQFEAFRALVADRPREAPHAAPRSTDGQHGGRVAPPAPSGDDAAILERIVKRAGKVFSLSVRPQGSHAAAEAALVLLFAHSVLGGNAEAGGGELKEGLRVSGLDVARLDRLMDRHAANALVIASGNRRGVKYQLTNPGSEAARILAKELRALVP